MLPFLLFLLLHVPPSLSDDAVALLEFKKGVKIDPSGLVSTSWNKPLGSVGCPESWYGIRCNAGRVVEVRVSGLGLEGEVKFATLVNLTKLEVLDLSENNLTGRLVPGLGLMSAMRSFNVGRNAFYGPLPDKVMDLWGLNYLNLSFNRFDGWFPERIWNLQQLRELDLRGNGLWGDVGMVLSKLRNNEYVDFSGNKLFGGLRMEAANLTSVGNTVKYLNLSGNELVGGFFSSESMGVFRNLEVLDVSDNKLSGELPGFGTMMAFKVFKAANNELKGALPSKLFGNVVPLRELDLSRNGFTGSIPTIISTSINILNLSSNELSGSLPSNVGNCVQLDLSKNQLTGDLSAIPNWGGLLQIVDLSSNELSGDFPNLGSQFEALRSISMRDNSIGGRLQLESHQSLVAVDLSMNKLTGALPPGLFTSLNLTYLNLSGNHFSGHIPIESSRSTESLVLPSSPLMEYLDLSVNSLSGPLLSDIVSLKKLKLLNLRRNSLSGRIPDELVKLDYLEYVDLSYNHFNGKIPDIAQPSLVVFNVSYNDLIGAIPQGLRRFPDSCFHPGNALLIYPDAPPGGSTPGIVSSADKHRRLKSRIRLAIIVGCVGAVILIFFIFMAVYKIRTQELCGRNASRDLATTGRHANFRNFALSFCHPCKDKQSEGSINYPTDHLMSSGSGTRSSQKELIGKQVDYGFSDGGWGSADLEMTKKSASEGHLPSSGSPGSALSSSPRFVESNMRENPVVLNVYSPDRLVGELFFLDKTLLFTAEALSRAPAEVLGRSSHGTSYKATLDNGHSLTVKWLRVGLVKCKKDLAKELRKIGAIRHPNIVTLRGYYWGPKEQERLVISDYVAGDSLALHLYESTPRRYSRLTFAQRLKIVVDIARCLCYLHQDRGSPHGNLKPTNILLSGPDLTPKLTDYGLHHLMTVNGIAEQMLNLGALGYRAPELATVSKPLPSFKADVYAFGVIVMELLTKRSAGDIISGQCGAVDLTDWVRMCAREGRGYDCFDRDIAGTDEVPKAMEELLAISLKCILPVNERPNIKTIFEELHSITA